MKNKIIRWIQNQVKHAGARGLVLGVSGGIDSAVVLSLAVKALGKNRVAAVYIPCQSHAQDERDARLICKRLGVKLKIIKIDAVFQSLISVLPPADNMTVANIKPRLRMIVLYYFARKLQYLVCGTSNKSELMTGYFTKYGDSGVDISPLAGLLKGQVCQLAEELSIPDEIIQKTPTAGLYAGQTDEGDLGLTYALLDAILDAREKGKKIKGNTIAVGKVNHLIATSQHKRSGPVMFVE